jgi:hypothetical protein
VAPVIDDDIEIPGVDVEGTEALDEAPAPQVEINDLDIPQDDPAPIEVAPPQESTAPAIKPPVITPAHAQGFRRSNRVRTQAKQAYTPSMTGAKYSYAVINWRPRECSIQMRIFLCKRIFIKPSPELWQLL